jgi:predicted acyl esterase
MAVRIPMDATGYSLPAGSVLRLSLTSSYWPLVWPGPAPGARLEVRTERHNTVTYVCSLYITLAIIVEPAP